MRERNISPFLVQPVFRDDGYMMMLVSQFQAPSSHFLLTYLEDFRRDPNAATPLLHVSVYTDYAVTKHISLVRGQVVDTSLESKEAHYVVASLLDTYQHDFASVQTFNESPAQFNIDDYIGRMRQRWKMADTIHKDPVEH